jgi:protein gp37
MSDNTSIEWTDATFNPWIGCTAVSPGCDHCYAERLAVRFKLAEWGTGKPRRLAHDEYWKQPLAWNRKAERTGKRMRVFCASMADVFDNEVPGEWRDRLWALIRSTLHLDWLLLTKRVGNIKKMLPDDWGEGYSNVWLGISVVNQQEADRDIPKLLTVPARVRFLSMEPLLGPVDISIYLASGFLEPPFTDVLTWIILGGESGPGARPMDPAWVRSIRHQCVVAGAAFHFKQWGAWGEILSTGNHGRLPYRDGMVRFGKKRAGRLLDGREWNEFPEVR